VPFTPLHQEPCFSQQGLSRENYFLNLAAMKIFLTASPAILKVTATVAGDALCQLSQCKTL